MQEQQLLQFQRVKHFCAVTIDFATSNYKTAGSDYTATNGLTFGAGDTSRLQSITDSTDENMKRKHHYQ